MFRLQKITPSRKHKISFGECYLALIFSAKDIAKSLIENVTPVVGRRYEKFTGYGAENFVSFRT